MINRQTHVYNLEYEKSTNLNTAHNAALTSEFLMFGTRVTMVQATLLKTKANNFIIAM